MLVGPGEGAGVVDIGDGIAIAVRIESHNHPSAVEPYQGAATGVGGIIRDIFSMGARPIALMDPLRFGSLDDARTRYLFEGVVSGISGYGNSVGVPTVGGEAVFDDTYRDNPLVNVLCLGILPKERLVLARAEGAGNLAVLLGSSTGRDGIGGASVLASASFEEGGEAKRPVGAGRRPVRGEAAHRGVPRAARRRARGRRAGPRRGRPVVRGVGDRGQGGRRAWTSTSRASPKREPGMNAVEVMTSESQERMLAIVEPAKLDAVLALARRWEIRATVVGRVTDTDALSRVRRTVRRGRRARARTRRRRSATTPPVVVVGRAADRRRSGREPRRRAAAITGRSRARAAQDALQAADPRRAAARQVPGRRRPHRRVARAARDADDRRQDVGLAPVRPPTVPQHRRRTGRRRRGAAREGHRQGARARDRRQGALLPPRSAHGRAGWWCSKRRATSRARARGRSRS